MEVDDEDEDFNLIQPSLIQQLRKILDEYPDDGQILKVLFFHFQLLTFSLFYIFKIMAMSMDFKTNKHSPDQQCP